MAKSGQHLYGICAHCQFSFSFTCLGETPYPPRLPLWRPSRLPHIFPFSLFFFKGFHIFVQREKFYDSFKILFRFVSKGNSFCRAKKCQRVEGGYWFIQPRTTHPPSPTQNEAGLRSLVRLTSSIDLCSPQIFKPTHLSAFWIANNNVTQSNKSSPLYQNFQKCSFRNCNCPSHPPLFVQTSESRKCILWYHSTHWGWIGADGGLIKGSPWNKPPWGDYCTNIWTID